MSETDAAGQFPATGTTRPLAVRMSDDLRAQLELIAQLNDRSVTEEVRHAVEAWIDRSKADPKVLARADAVREGIERDAETKRNTIAAVFGSSASGKARGKPDA